MQRCAWVSPDDPLYVSYHDKEWGVPVHDDRKLFEFLILVAPGDPELRVTIAWDDPPGTPNVDPVLVNDLDLRVFDPEGTLHHPWTLDPANPSAPAVRTQRDGVNNIEQVLVQTPVPGAWRVQVVGFDVPQGPVQTFGAVVHGSPEAFPRTSHLTGAPSSALQPSAPLHGTSRITPLSHRSAVLPSLHEDCSG